MAGSGARTTSIPQVMSLIFFVNRLPLQHHKAVWSDDRLPAPSGYEKRQRDGAVTHKSPFPTSLLHLMFHLVSLRRLRWKSPPRYASPEWVTTTYDHTHWRTRDPVCSPIDKPVRAELVVGSVTTSESSVSYVFFPLHPFFFYLFLSSFSFSLVFFFLFSSCTPFQ